MQTMIHKANFDYYEMFRDASRISERAAQTLQNALISGTVNQSELAEVKHIENEGDRLMHEAMRVLERAFITPLDFNDMVALLQSIERVTDAIDQVAQHFYMLHIHRSDSYIDELVDLLVKATYALSVLCDVLHEHKRSPERLREQIIAINRYEESADQVYLGAVHKLYDGATSALDVMRLQAIYTKLEDALDCCEDVADVVETVLVASDI